MALEYYDYPLLEYDMRARSLERDVPRVSYYRASSLPPVVRDLSPYTPSKISTYDTGDESVNKYSFSSYYSPVSGSLVRYSYPTRYNSLPRDNYEPYMWRSTYMQSKYGIGYPSWHSLYDKLYPSQCSYYKSYPSYYAYYSSYPNYYSYYRNSYL